MAARVPEPPIDGPLPAPPGAPEAQRQARYTYLVGRLRSRQITMEEATELFALMQAMLRASETARRTMVAPASPTPAMTPQLGRAAPAPSGGSDDMFLVGLLAMGAGAGLLAAMARKLAEGPTPRNEPGAPERRTT